jgi:hypothetical protein
MSASAPAALVEVGAGAVVVDVVGGSVVDGAVVGGTAVVGATAVTVDDGAVAGSWHFTG